MRFSLRCRLQSRRGIKQAERLSKQCLTYTADEGYNTTEAWNLCVTGMSAFIDHDIDMCRLGFVAFKYQARQSPYSCISSMGDNRHFLDDGSVAENSPLFGTRICHSEMLFIGDFFGLEVSGLLKRHIKAWLAYARISQRHMTRMGTTLDHDLGPFVSFLGQISSSSSGGNDSSTEAIHQV